MDIRPRPEQIIKWATEAGLVPAPAALLDLPPWHYGGSGCVEAGPSSGQHTADVTARTGAFRIPAWTAAVPPRGIAGLFEFPGARSLGPITTRTAPGTWQQVLPAAVAADPASGTVPTGYLVLNVTTGTVKRHAGGYVWEMQIGGSSTARIGFWGATPVVQPSGANQAAVTLGNTDGEIAGLTISDPPTQAEVQALRDACEELADDVRALSALVHALRGALVAVGVVKGGA